MTEELQKEAEEKADVYFDSLDIDNGNVSDTPFSSYDVFVAYEKGYLAGAEPREKRIAELEKENAELKGLKDVATLIRANNDTVITLMQLNNMLVSKSQQLTKAKEIIKTFCGFCSVFNSTNGSFDNLIAEAEQFIKESE
jgi:hypothetical protein